MIAANQVGGSQGFEADDNELLVIWDGGSEALERQPKAQLADRLVNLIADRFDAQTSAQDS